MPQRDYLLRQIELMAMAIAEIVKRILGIKTGIVDEELEKETNEMLKEQLDTSLDEIINIPSDNIATFLVQEKTLHESNVENFAEMLTLYAKIESDNNRKEALLKNALALLKWYDQESSTFSFNRQDKIARISDMLQNI